MSKNTVQMLKLSGNNKYSQLSEKSNSKSMNGSSSIYPPIISHLPLSSISSYSTYWYHTVVIMRDGESIAIGDNSEGQIISSLPRHKLTKFTKFCINDSTGHQWYPISAVCGADYTLYLVSYSKNSTDQIRLVYSHKFIKTEFPLFLNTGNSIPVSLFGGYSNAAAIDSEGSVIFIPESIVEFPTAIIDPVPLPEGEKATSIACCNEFILVAGTSGRVFISNVTETDDEEEDEDDGQIKVKFSLVKNLEDIKIVDVCGTSFHCFAVADDGRVFGRGSNGSGELGIGNKTAELDEFAEISSLSKHKVVAAYASDHSLFLCEGGKVLVCGSNQSGELIGIRPTKSIVYLPSEAGVERGATFCIAGWETSAVFIGYDPSKSPNRRISIEKVAASKENPTEEKDDSIHLKTGNGSINSDKDKDEKTSSPNQPSKPEDVENADNAKTVGNTEKVDDIEKLDNVKKEPEINLNNNTEDRNAEKVTSEQSTSSDHLSKQKVDESTFIETEKSAANFFINSSEEENFFISEGKVGEGPTSHVYKLCDKRMKSLVCKKVLKYKTAQTTINNRQEALKKLKHIYDTHHPSVCKLVGVNLSDSVKTDDDPSNEVTKVSLFLEYLDYNLDAVLKKGITNTLKARIVIDVAHAMRFLHERGFVHKNLKSDNVMFNSFFETKVTDFGFVDVCNSVINDYELLENSSCFDFMSPELINKKEIDNKTDVYSFGIVLYLIFVGCLPNHTLDDKLSGKEVDIHSASEFVSPFCIELISRCISKEPSSRPSFGEVLTLLRNHSYELAPDIDASILSKRDKELNLIENRE